MWFDRWQDSCNDVGITYDTIGNPLNDGVRTYTWGAGRQLRHISMNTGEAHGIRINNGVHEESNTLLHIVRDVENSKLTAKVMRDGRDISAGCAVDAFVWTKNGNAAGTGKDITITSADAEGDVEFRCSYSETQGIYGTVNVSDDLVVSHTPGIADANHRFSLEDGMLKVEIPDNADNSTDYELINGTLSVNPGFSGTITAEYSFTTSPTREIDFDYDHNGMRTRKTVVENGITTIYDYTLHGKLITHLTRRTVGAEDTEELHFFYDAQSRPVFVEYNGTKYLYIHNLQGDIVGIVDETGELMVEYKYDAWGKPISVTGSMAGTLGKLNPFRYRGYVWDRESDLFYLDSRYYSPKMCRFISGDQILGLAGRVCEHNLYMYCRNRPINCQDVLGYTTVYVNVYLKNLFDYGHVDISIDEFTASYGRYGEVDEENGGLTGEGILVIDNYGKSYYESLKKGRMIFRFELEMNDEEIDRLRSFYTNQMTEENYIRTQSTAKGQAKYYRVQDYHIRTSNCTTKVVDALGYAYGEEKFPYGDDLWTPHIALLLLEQLYKAGVGIVKSIIQLN